MMTSFCDKSIVDDNFINIDLNEGNPARSGRAYSLGEGLCSKMPPAKPRKQPASQPTAAEVNTSPVAPDALDGKVETEPAQASRHERRRRDTRFRLMGAALTLMSEKGLHGVSIQDITNQADVGFGSFYNHFPSKEAIHEALKAEVIGRFAAALDKLGEQVADPAEKVAASTRYTLRQGRQDPVWGRFVLAASFNRASATTGLGQYLVRDVINGIAAGRFQCHDLPSLLVAAGGIILAGLAAEVEPVREGIDPVGSPEDLPERIASTVLHTLGLGWDEASAVARRPLPAVSLPSNPLRT
jgi:AcrR family transcriptional regulator